MAVDDGEYWAPGGRRPWRDRHEPQIYDAYRWGAWACCSCRWTSGEVHGGAVGASVAWGRHMAGLARRGLLGGE